MATEKQIKANRENAQLSCGAVTPEGKAICSHNAVKTGLTGQTVLLKTDDVEAYNKHIQRFVDKFAPVNDDERALTQDLADTEWRLLRIMPLEAGILANGRINLAPQFAEETDPAVRDLRLEAEVVVVYRKDLSNLALQQTRLRRQRLLITEELNKLQQERKARVALHARRAADYYLESEQGEPLDFAAFGFEIALEDVVEDLAAEKARQHGDKYPEVTKKTYRTEFRAALAPEFARR
jgi:hypothetical protein